MATAVTVAVRSLRDGSRRDLTLGEFHAVWKAGISIGRDPACTVVLDSPDVAPVAARLAAASNHKMLLRLPAGARLPLPAVESFQGWERVDYQEFQIGSFGLKLAEISVADTAERCACSFAGGSGRCSATGPLTASGFCPYCDDAPAHDHCTNCGRVLRQMPRPGQYCDVCRPQLVRCRGCFEDHVGGVPCPRCGYHDAAPVSPRALAPGTLLHNDHFVIGRVLGTPGGFGITYLAWDQRFTIRVAIKEFFPRGLASRDAGRAAVVVEADDRSVFEDGLRGFLDEARRVAQFASQPHIVRVRHFFEQHGTGYLVMDYYEGQTLAEYARDKNGNPRRLAEHEAIELMLPVLDGLREIHEQNLLHRDIKPENIYLARRKQTTVPLLLDFGAARELVSRSSRSRILTSGFAPWEQYLTRGPQGPWTDIYACAATLYVLTTRKVPPDGLERKEETDELVPPEKIVAELSAPFCHAVRLGLEVEPKKRPQTVDAFSALLRAALLKAPTLKPVPPPAPAAVAEDPKKTTPLPAGTRLRGRRGVYAIEGSPQIFKFHSIYHARVVDQAFQREVALQVFDAQTSKDARRRESIERRFEALSTLASESIVKAYDLGFDGDVFFVAMEYVHGHSLAQRLHDGPVGVEEAIRIGIQIAGALQDAHDRKQVHGGVNEACVRIRNDVAKLTDWFSVVDHAGDDTDFVVDMIKSGSAGDLFCLGALLYTALAGYAAAPFGAPQIFRAIRHLTLPPLRTRNRAVPSDLERVIERMLQHNNPALRYQNAREIAAALLEVQERRLKSWPPEEVGIVSGMNAAGNFDPLFRDRLRDLLAQGCKRLVLDLSAVRSDKATSLVKDVAFATAQALKSKAQLRVVCGGRVKKTLEQVRLDQAFSIFDTVEGAVASFDQPVVAPSSVLRADGRFGEQGQYLIVQHLADGYNPVFLARRADKNSDRFLALKIFRPHEARGADWVETIHARLNALAEITHGSMPKVEAVGSDRGMPYLAMAYEQGLGLDNVLRAGKVDIPRALDLGIQVASALQAAHDRGVLHGHVSARNVLIRQDDGSVVLMGWDPTPYPSGVMIGGGIHPPEVLNGAAYEARSDLYGLGGLLYWVFTGRPLDPPNFLKPAPPSVSERNPKMPGDIAAIVERLLQTDPALRYQNARDVVAALRGVEERLAKSSQGAPATPAADLPIGARLQGQDRDYVIEGPLRRHGAEIDFDIVAAAKSGKHDRTFPDRVRELVARDRKKIVIDLSGIKIAEDVLAADLVQAFAIARKAGADLRVAAARESVAKMLRTFKLDTVFSIYDTAVAAVASFHQPPPAVEVRQDPPADAAARPGEATTEWERDLVTAQALVDDSRFAQAVKLLLALTGRHAGSPGRTGDRLMHLTCALLGTAYFRLGDYTQAIHWTTEARDLCVRLEDRDHAAIHERNIAQMEHAFVWLAFSDGGRQRLKEVRRGGPQAIGRAPDADVFVGHASIARRHFTLERDEQDQISARSTGHDFAVDGVKVGDSAVVVPPGSRLQAGAVEMRLVSKAADVPALVEPPADESPRIVVRDVVPPSGELLRRLPDVEPWPPVGADGDSTVAVIVVIGTVPFRNKQVWQTVRGLLLKGRKRIVIDLAEARMLPADIRDSIEGPWLEARKAGGEIRIWRPSSVIREVMRMSKIDQKIPIHDVEPWTIA